jgi:dienelactone hydrolase
MRGVVIDHEDKRFVRSAAFWTLMADDLKSQLAGLEKNASIPPGRIVLVGASLGANVVFRVLAERPDLRGAVLLSPGLNYAGYETEALPAIVKRPVLLVAAKPDLYAYESARRLRSLFPKGAPVDFFDLPDGTPRGSHGAQLFDGTLETRLLNWIRRQI